MFEINLSAKIDGLDIALEDIEAATFEAVQYAVEQAVINTYDEAKRLAQERLVTTRADYIKGLNLESPSANVWIISLNGKIPNMWEDGFPSFDMKPGLLAGPNSKFGKNGEVYNTVPYRHQIYSKVATNKAGPTLRDAAKILIFKQNLNKTIRDGATNRPVQGLAGKLGPTTVKNLQGLAKYQNTYNSAKTVNGQIQAFQTTQSQYLTFRRVSTASDPSKWIHPGYKGAQIFPDLEHYLDFEVDNILKILL